MLHPFFLVCYLLDSLLVTLRSFTFVGTFRLFFVFSLNILKLILIFCPWKNNEVDQKICAVKTRIKVGSYFLLRLNCQGSYLGYKASSPPPLQSWDKNCIVYVRIFNFILRLVRQKVFFPLKRRNGSIFLQTLIRFVKLSFASCRWSVER